MIWQSYPVCIFCTADAAAPPHLLYGWMLLSSSGNLRREGNLRIARGEFLIRDEVQDRPVFDVYMDGAVVVLLLQLQCRLPTKAAIDRSADFVYTLGRKGVHWAPSS